MNYVKFVLDQNYGDYSSQEVSNVEMSTLGMFLSDIGCSIHNNNTFKSWALADKNDPHSEFTYIIGTMATYLEEDDESNIHIVDHTGSNTEDDHSYIPPEIIMTRQQFAQLLDDWREKVCKPRPEKVIIKHENDQFSIETKP